LFKSYRTGDQYYPRFVFTCEYDFDSCVVSKNYSEGNTAVQSDNMLYKPGETAVYSTNANSPGHDEE
jgi:hypothetical protein